MPVYETRFAINASPQQVWNAVVSFDRYPEWNPQIRAIRGSCEVGAAIKLTLCLPDRPVLDVSARIEQVEPFVRLTWRGHVIAPWFFEGYRRFEIEAVGEGRVMFTHVEDVHGVVGPIFSLLMGTAQRRSHKALNGALKTRAEAHGVS